jgi:SAM-dependent methyltransferase
MSGRQQEFWEVYYQRVFRGSSSWLDYSNDRVQAQTFAVTLEAVGPISGRRCLDVGCGRGQFALALSSFGASEVVGVDIVEEVIANRERYPVVRWECARIEDQNFYQSLGSFDILVALEMLQYVDAESALRSLWERVAPGGRLIGIVPNAEDPLVQKTVARFEGNYRPLAAGEIRTILEPLPGLEYWAYRGMAFQADQRLAPYAVSPWMNDARSESSFNRLVFAALRSGLSSTGAPSGGTSS